MLESTFVMIKPADFDIRFEVQDYICSRVCPEFMRVASIENVDMDLIYAHYEEHMRGPYKEIIEAPYLERPSVHIMQLFGKGIIEDTKSVCGLHFDPLKCGSETVRAIYGRDGPNNTVHRSNDLPDSIRENGIWAPCFDKYQI